MVGHVADLLDEPFRRAAQLIYHDGVDYVATSEDEFIVEYGRRVPGNGELIAALHAVTDKWPGKRVVYGKTHRADLPLAVEILQRQLLGGLSIDHGRLLMVGGNPRPDIRFALNAEIQGVLMLTGITSADAAAALGLPGSITAISNHAQLAAHVAALSTAWPCVEPGR